MLEPIVETTRARIEAIRPLTANLQTEVRSMAPARRFEAALAAGGLGVIAEIKRRSPSRGVLDSGLDPATRAKDYEAGGACAVSVLTEPDHFDGSDEDLRTVKAAVGLPVLRKDFVLDEVQVWETRVMGADAMLLIVALLSDDQLAHLSGLAAEAGLAALVEVHTEEEAERALAVQPRIVGVNNRDLRTFDVSLETAERIAPLLADVPVTVGESGIFTGADAQRMRDAGYDAVLVGESLVTSGNPAVAIAELRRP